MIEYVIGDILKSDTEAIVNTVNCVGIMGKGLALDFKKKFPENFNSYKIACDENKVKAGNMFVYDTQELLNPKFIINFPTKRHWKNNSRIKDIEDGLKALYKEITARNIESISIPPLGCGNGGLEWIDVHERIINVLKDLKDVKILLYVTEEFAQQVNKKLEESSTLAKLPKNPAKTPRKHASENTEFDLADYLSNFGLFPATSMFNKQKSVQPMMEQSEGEKYPNLSDIGIVYAISHGDDDSIENIATNLIPQHFGSRVSDMHNSTGEHVHRLKDNIIFNRISNFELKQNQTHCLKNLISAKGDSEKRSIL